MGGQAFRQLCHHFVQARQAHSRQQGAVLGLYPAQLDVLADGAVEQGHILRHIANLAAHGQWLQLGVDQLIQQHTARAGGMLVEHQLEQGAFARTQLADHAHLLARTQFEVQALDHWWLVGVGKSHIAELECAHQRWRFDTGVVLVGR